VDGAPLPADRWPVGGRLGWLLPAGARAAELGTPFAVVVPGTPGLLPWLFAWGAAGAAASYDLTYRGRLAGSTAVTGPSRHLGWPARLGVALLAAALAAAGAGRAAAVLLGVGAVVVGVGVLRASRAAWRGSLTSSP
jgi:hypothetical protein